ncbi:hypothetical protein K438DRAFT_1972347 [Mycena galopus ATCC 62051]|nr:hypothetical protein K438DRAFT_1972347 [Mycena galopus ATCC 62051]
MPLRSTIQWAFTSADPTLDFPGYQRMYKREKGNRRRLYPRMSAFPCSVTSMSRSGAPRILDERLGLWARSNPNRLFFFCIAASANSTLGSGMSPSCACTPFHSAIHPWSVVYYMHCDHPHCPPPARLQQHDIERGVPSHQEATTTCLMHPARLRPRPQRQAPAHPRDAAQQALSFLNVRAALRDPAGAATDLSGRLLRPFATVYATFHASRRSSNYHLHYGPRAQRLLFFIAGPALRRVMRRSSASQGYHRRRSSPTRPMPCLRTLGARRAALEAVRVYNTKKLLSHTRNVPLRRSYPHVRFSASELGVRHPPQVQTRCTLRAIYCVNATYHDDTLDTTPARSPAPTHTASRTGSAVPPSPLDTRACRALQQHPQHYPRPRRAPRSHPHHLRQPFSTVHAAFVASPLVLATHSAVSILRSRPGPDTHHERAASCTSPTHALRPSSAAFHLYGAHADDTFVPSPHAPTICGVHPPSSLDSPACTYLGTVPSTTCVRNVRRGYSPQSALRPSHLSTAPILSAITSCMQHENNGSTRPRRYVACTAAWRQRAAAAGAAATLCAGINTPPRSSASSRQLRLPFGTSQAHAGARGGGLLTTGLLEKC